MKIREIMTENPDSVSFGTSIGDVAALMRDLDVGIVPVVHDGDLRGVITDRDITIRVTAAGLGPYEASVQDFLSPNVVTISPDADVDEARRLMVTEGGKEDGKLVGVLSIGDIAVKDSSEDTETGEVLQDISEPTKD
ncbi:MAG: CBS domain-containing protein [Chloroflexota bacterium]|nr:CBS domain-containing protein [Chloroflexota bacterium]